MIAEYNCVIAIYEFFGNLRAREQIYNMIRIWKHTSDRVSVNRETTARVKRTKKDRARHSQIVLKKKHSQSYSHLYERKKKSRLKIDIDIDWRYTDWDERDRGRMGYRKYWIKELNWIIYVDIVFVSSFSSLFAAYKTTGT